MLRLNARVAFCFSGFAGLLLSGCASTPDPIIGPASIEPVAALGQADYRFARGKTYLLRPSDKISVNVFREPDFTLDAVQIGVEGNISLPMIGSIPAAGKTAASLEADLTQRLGQLGVKTPMVSINIVEYASHLVTVEGSVDQPGVYKFQPGSRLSAAIAMAGGPSRTAKRDQVAVFRETEAGMSIAKFDYGMMGEGTMLDPILEPGDRVVMGTDGLSVFWQDLLKALPAFGVFATAAIQ